MPPVSCFLPESDALFTVSLPALFIWNPARTVWPRCCGISPQPQRALVFNVLQLQCGAQTRGPKATLTHFLFSKPQLQTSAASFFGSKNSASNPEPRLSVPLCPLYLQRIVNTVNANMVLQDRKQLQAEVKRPGCFLRDGQLVTAILRRPPSPAVIASDGSAFALPKGRQRKNCHMWNLIFGMWSSMFFCGGSWKWIFSCAAVALILVPVDLLGLPKAPVRT